MKKPKLQKLIQEIAMFDMDAAYKLHKRKDKYNDNTGLQGVMVWEETIEQHEYWSDINKQLAARRKNYHPHRDLMIEYANDKTIEIEYLRVVDGSWREYKEPAFYADVKYRKKPKVTKKTIECRIYLDTHGEINIIECRSYLDTHGEINIVERDAALNIRNLKKWLSDWQKVEIEVEEND